MTCSGVKVEGDTAESTTKADSAVDESQCPSVNFNTLESNHKVRIFKNKSLNMLL